VVRLDHLQVIQSQVGTVFHIMNVVAHCRRGFAARWAILPPGRLENAGWRVAMTAEPRTDAAHWSRLIMAVGRDHDREAFAALFGYFAPRVKTFMRRSGINEASADELAQETMILVWRKAHLFQPSHAGAPAWIFRIARNLRIDALRRERRKGGHETIDTDAAFRVIEAAFQVEAAPQPDAQIAAAQADKLVQAALAELSGEQMRVVELSFYQDRAHAEIAQILQIPLGTVKSRLRLAMNRLRNALGELS
jgi:RNA polymerase sigma-70 factor (ECF subfamily)